MQQTKNKAATPRQAAFQKFNNARSNLLLDVSTQFSLMRVPIHSIVAKDTKDGRSFFNVSISAEGAEHLKTIIDRLSKIPGINSVERATN